MSSALHGLRPNCTPRRQPCGSPLAWKGCTAMRCLTSIAMFVTLCSTLSLPASAQLVALSRQQWMSTATSVLPISARQRASISGVSNTSSYLSFGKTATVNEIGSDQVVWGRNSELTSGDVVATFCGPVPTKMFWSFSSAVSGFCRCGVQSAEAAARITCAKPGTFPAFSF